ncbi:MAG: InlB B-repeat-containing protein [Treponema sp.]|uniref:InlB B-repeat-containing protein n=1 Tax=Treponema sp. TaxID=166 RepID=UPI002A90CECC|nr:InlB B-repeat-containing protein [Treponema sp.]MDY6397222.1 InlB B-repeat-containing protein [Treponema sp.]
MKNSLFKKIFFLLAMVLLSAGIFSACSSDSGSDDGESGTNYFAGKTFYGKATLSDVYDVLHTTESEATDEQKARAKKCEGTYDYMSIAFAETGNDVTVTYFEFDDDKPKDLEFPGSYTFSNSKAKITVSFSLKDENGKDVVWTESLTTTPVTSSTGSFSIDFKDEETNKTYTRQFSLTKGKKLNQIGEPDYIKITYNANFVAEGADSAQTVEYTVELTSDGIKLPLNTFTREGYVFKGWGAYSSSFYASYNDGETTKDIKEDKTLYAIWGPKNFTITYNANFVADGATEAETVTQKVDATTDLDSYGYFTLQTNTFTRGGDYVFMGWNSYSGSTYASYSDGDSVSLERDTTLYAIWKTKSELTKIIFNANDGSSSPETKIQYVDAGSYVTLQANTFTREGYSFVGWAKSADAETKDYTDSYYFQTSSDVTLYAVWKDELHYVITFDANGGEGTMAKQLVDKDSATVTLNANAFTKSGYVFYGWSTSSYNFSSSITHVDGEEITVSDDKKLYAVWLSDSPYSSVKVTFNANDGSDKTKTQYLKYVSTTYSSDSYYNKLAANTFTRKDYKFKGWATSADSSYVSYNDKHSFSYKKMTSPLTLYAVWEFTGTCTITFNANDGSENPATSTQEAAGGLSAYLDKNTFTREGYTFLGWSESSDDASYSYEDGADYTPRSEKVTLYAIWQKNPVITFIGNGGTDSKGNTSVTQVVEYGKMTALSANTFTKSDSTFAGWSKSSIGTYSLYSDEESVSIKNDLTLYAIWKDPVDVTLNMNGGSGANIISSAKYSNGNFYFTFPEVESTKEGYVLAGWATSETAVSPSYETGSTVRVDKSTTYYAVWIQTTGVTVNVSVKEVTSPDDVSLTYDENSHSLKAALDGTNSFVWFIDGKTIEYTGASFNIYELTEGLHTVMVANLSGSKSATAVVTVTKQ